MMMVILLLNKKKIKNMGILISIVIAGVIGYFWGKGFDHMKKNHPDYNGDDFLN